MTHKRFSEMAAECGIHQHEADMLVMILESDAPGIIAEASDDDYRIQQVLWEAAADPRRPVGGFSRAECLEAIASL